MTDPNPEILVEVSFGTGPLDPPTWITLPDVVRSVSCTHGRTNEQEPAQPGSLDVALDNSTGDFTPNRAASIYYPNVTADRQVRVMATPPGGSMRQIASGFTETWPASVEGGFDYASAGMHANDAFALLAARQLRSFYTEQLLGDAPMAFYPLSESSGSEVGEFASTWPNGRIVHGKGDGGGTYALGAAALGPYDPGTSLGFAPHFASSTATDGGYEVEIARPGTSGPFLTPTGGFSLALAFNSNTANILNYLFVQSDTAGNPQVEVTVDQPGGVLHFTLYRTRVSSEFLTDGTIDWLDGGTHLGVFVLEADAKTMRIYVDGVLRATHVAGTAITFAQAPRASYAGGPASPAGDWYLSGRLSHLALWDSPLTAGQIADQRRAFLGWPGDTSGVRVGRILDVYGWPSAARALDAGWSTVAPSDPSGLTVLEAVQQCADAEQGVFFIAGDGDATFQDRGRRLATTSVLTLAAADVGPSDLTFELDGQRIFNDVTVTSSGATGRAVDDISIGEHGRRTLAVDRPLVVDDEAQPHAEWLLGLCKQGVVRCPALTVDPLTEPSLWAAALDTQVSDRITVTGLPATAPASSLDFFVEGVTHDGSPGDSHWQTSWPVSPAPSVTWFVWDVSEWDTDDVLAY